MTDRELLQEVRADIKEIRKEVTELKVAAARRDGKLYLAMAIFGTIGGALVDVVRRKFLG